MKDTPLDDNGDSDDDHGIMSGSPLAVSTNVFVVSHCEESLPRFILKVHLDFRRSDHKVRHFRRIGVYPGLS